MTTGLQLDPGELDQRVTIRERVQVSDGAGGFTETWQDFATRWMKVRTMSGERRFAAAQTDYPRDTEFTMRRDAGVTEDMALVWNGMAFGIGFIEDHGPRAPYMRIEAASGDKQDALP
jgi:SPP1 family predicted phage head-tail adaptor